MAEFSGGQNGKGRRRDNVMIEWLWRSLKYECIYLHAYEPGSEILEGLNRWIDYNMNCPHSSLDDRTPGEAYWQRPRRPLLQNGGMTMEAFHLLPAKLSCPEGSPSQCPLRS